jgi:hypothetical protein
MNHKLTRKLNPYLWQGICLAISIIIFSLILVNRSPNLLRPISMSMRTGFGLVIPVTALLLYLCFRIPDRVGDLISMTAVLSIFAMPLAGLWASGQSQSVAVSGLIPLTDAANYYHDSLRIIAGQSISHFSAMRPFFPGFLSFLMNLTGRNFMFSLAIITAIAAVAIYYTVREIQRTHGAEAAVFLLIILFLYFRHHSGTSMSETLGVPLGALGIGLIWRGLEKRSQSLAIFGLFVSAFAMNVRPGTMFILPFMLLWVGWVFRKPNKYISIKLLFWGAGAIVLSFVLNSLTIRLLAEPSGTAFSNFSWALYGLASGGNSYTYIFEKHPELLLIPDPAQSRTIYRMALELMIQSPNLFIKGAFHNWGMFFSDSWYSAFSFLEGENGLRYIYRITRWMIYTLCALGFIKWILKPADPYGGLVGMAAIGVLISVPFVPPTDAYRVRLYAASIVIFGLLPAMGAALIISQFKLKIFSPINLEIQATNITAIFSALLILVILSSPLIVKASHQQPPSLEFSCPSNSDQIAVRFDPGTSVNIMREKDLFLDWMPNFHQGLFRRSIHDLADNNLIAYFDSLRAGTSLVSTLDLLSSNAALIVIPTDMLLSPDVYLGICGQWAAEPGLKKYNIFFAGEALRLK